MHFQVVEITLDVALAPIALCLYIFTVSVLFDFDLRERLIKQTDTKLLTS
jgi:hypothetical protein